MLQNLKSLKNRFNNNSVSAIEVLEAVAAANGDSSRPESARNNGSAKSGFSAGSVREKNSVAVRTPKKFVESSIGFDGFVIDFGRRRVVWTDLEERSWKL